MAQSGAGFDTYRNRGIGRVQRSEEKATCDRPACRIGGYLTCNTLYHILNIFEYYTPVVMMLCIFAAAGGERLSVLASEKWKEPEAKRPLSMLKSSAVMLAFMIPILVNKNVCDRHNADYVRTMADNMLNGLPHNAILIAYGDNEVFPIWYDQEVLHKRRDVALIPRDFFIQWASPDGRQIDNWCIQRIELQHPETNAAAFMRRSEIDPDYAMWPARSGISSEPP